ncbi:zinc finger and SCAN domain-containing protein 22-like isoform X1 [Salmo salar]|uniref:Zinc finger and SCAN domain-containing protein 22-like isoform X1 n=1 Tax=Salmo salar TaxID=8030 RepID=A0A1S3RF91_SALSA|nr:zinc finger and SCAN domain-containing protein 22-like isoform X1 [Salmo salar]|eukprot:XP_014050542.1 PREDICTED: zinc finger and SCAN domain-containing protein 22-like [Salmo salar]
MDNCMGFHTQIASVMEVLANAAVAEICKLVDDDYAVFRLEMSQSQKENRGLRRKLQLLELKVSRERAERTIRERVLASRPSSVKILDRYRGMAKGEGHLTGGHRSFVKPAGHNTWRDDQPITVDEGSGTSTQEVIVIESADAEAAGPGVKQERTKGEKEPRHSRDIQTEAAAGVAPTVATEDLAAVPQARTRRSIMEVSGTPNAVLKSETDTETLTVTHRLLHTGSDPERLGLWRLGCPPSPGSKYLPLFHQSQRTVNSRGDDGDTLDTGGDDPSCSYTTEMDPGNISLDLETQTDLSRGDWNQYSSSVYSEGCLEKKGEGLVVDEVTVKLEGDVPPTWKGHLGDGHSQGRDFLDYRESLETNPNVATHSLVHAFKDHDPVSTSMAPSDSHSHILFDQVLNSNDRATAQAQGGGATSGNSKEKRFLCMFCNKGFSCPQKVEIHKRVHTGEKPYSCTQCHVCFAQAGDLKRHQRVHSGEKPYSCPQCDKRFSRQDQLKRHNMVHTRERPFACMHCGKRFSERSYLRIHQQKNHSTQ